MKKGVPELEQNGNDNKRQRTELVNNDTAVEEPTSGRSLLSRAATWMQGVLFGFETIASNEVQQPEEIPSNAFFNTSLLEIWLRILSFANNPVASLVSRIFYSTQGEVLRLKYNLNKESHRPAFVKYKNEKGEDTNDAAIAQQKEIEYLLSREKEILSRTNKDEKVISCLKELKSKKFKTINPDEIMKFLARENIVEALNIAMIEAEILESKTKNKANLDCLGLSSLTRFPGKIITKHLEYFKTLEFLSLYNNRLQVLPPEIGQLVALKVLRLGNNQLQSLTPEIGKLAALQTLCLHSNQLQSLPPEVGKLAVLQSLSVDNNHLQALPPEIGQLAALRHLCVDNNHLQNLPPEMSQLAFLNLSLDNNHLKSLPDNLSETLIFSTRKDKCSRQATKAEVLASQKQEPAAQDSKAGMSPIKTPLAR